MDLAVAPYPDLPDLYFSPLKVYEYLAAGLPVVASAVGQVPAALEGGRLGTLVRPGDAGALADALAALRADVVRRTALRAATRAAAVERHTWRAVVDRVLQLAGVHLAGVQLAGAEPARVAVTA
jgi:glycosyltransferase involved in cell wall biosynthesis